MGTQFVLGALNAHTWHMWQLQHGQPASVGDDRRRERLDFSVKSQKLVNH